MGLCCAGLSVGALLVMLLMSKFPPMGENMRMLLLVVVVLAVGLWWCVCGSVDVWKGGSGEEVVRC